MRTEDVMIKSSKVCSQCGKKLHHGQKAVAVINDRNKVKGITCNDDCAQSWTSFWKQGFGSVPTKGKIPQDWR